MKHKIANLVISLFVATSAVVRWTLTKREQPAEALILNTRMKIWIVPTSVKGLKSISFFSSHHYKKSRVPKGRGFSRYSRQILAFSVT